MITVLLVALGAALGAPTRFYANHWMREHGGTPTAGTLLVNVIGSLALGLIVGAGLDGSWLALLGVGFCGALTTFSTLALEIWDAVADDRPANAASNVGLSLMLGIGAAALGFALTR